MLAFAAAVLLLAQEDAGALVELLRSDSVVERDGAAKKLLALGAAAQPALEKAAKDPDAEVASRAGRILRILEIRFSIPPRLKAALPGIEDRLAAGVDRAWTDAFLSLIDDVNKPMPPSVTPEDLSFLVARAIRGADAEKVRVDLIRIAGARNLRGAIPELVSVLASSSPTLVFTAKRAILDLDAREAWPQILDVLGGKDFQASSNAQTILGELRIKEAVPGLVEYLRSETPHVRTNATYCLETLGGPEHAAVLLPLLRDRSVLVSNGAARALAAIGAKEAVGELRSLLADPECEDKGDAAYALGKLGAKEAIPDLIRALENPGKRDSRAEIAEALGALGAKEALPRLLQLLEDQDFQGQAELLPVIARLGGGAASPQIAACFRHEDAVVRAAALRAARSLKVGGLAPAAVGLLEDSSDEVWQEAMEAIVESGAAEVAPKLQAIAANENAREVSRRLAVLVLGRGGVRASVPFLRERLREGKSSPAIALCAAHALAELGAGEAVEDLRKLLGSTDDDVRTAAATALGRLGAKDAAGDLRKLLEGKGYSPRRAAARALAAVGDRDAVPLLRKALEDDDLRGPAALALAELGDRASIPTMLQALDFKDHDSLRDVVDALARLDPRAAEAKLKEDLAGPDREVRKEAAAGLCRLGSKAGASALLEAARGDTRLSLFALNAVRSPGAWRKLMDRKTSWLVPGGSLRTAPLLRLVAGTEVEVEESGFTTWMFDTDLEQGWAPALHALEGYEDDALLEEGRVRVLPDHRVRRFWQDWWRTESRSK